MPCITITFILVRWEDPAKFGTSRPPTVPATYDEEISRLRRLSRPFPTTCQRRCLRSQRISPLRPSRWSTERIRIQSRFAAGDLATFRDSGHFQSGVHRRGFVASDPVSMSTRTRPYRADTHLADAEPRSAGTSLTHRRRGINFRAAQSGCPSIAGHDVIHRTLMYVDCEYGSDTASSMVSKHRHRMSEHS